MTEPIHMTVAWRPLLHGAPVILDPE